MVAFDEESILSPQEMLEKHQHFFNADKETDLGYITTRGQFRDKDGNPRYLEFLPSFDGL